jgi:hypothetical protein
MHSDIVVRAQALIPESRTGKVNEPWLLKLREIADVMFLFRREDSRKMGGVGFVLNAQCMFDEREEERVCVEFLCFGVCVCVWVGVIQLKRQSTHLIVGESSDRDCHTLSSEHQHVC